MKNFLVLFLVVVSLSVYGEQPPTERERQRERIHGMKVAFITSAVSLSASESERFWPIYNEYWQSRRALAHQRMSLMRTIETQSVSAAQLAQYVNYDRQQADLIDKYIKKFSAILPVERVARIFVAEENFKGYLLREASKK